MKLAIAFTTYAGSIVAANFLTSNYGLVAVGFGMLVTAGTFAAGFALLARDFVQRHGGTSVALTAVSVGAVLSWFLSTPALAVASVVAFAGAELVDLAVFTALIDRLSFVARALTSNIISAPLDTVIFLWIAGFGVTTEAVTGQFVGKVIWATVVPLVIYIGVRRALLRQPVNPEGA